ncbi:hypothetical protein R4Z10_05060 [Niallia sp. XMNu-256]|uniref:hypothetical protein n=1 Tax=Niallia sp. XMNu-256 TaxID=3082444 RepID=UPI0030D5917C
MYKTTIEKDDLVIASIQRDLNLTIAFLILSGQLTIRGVIVTSGGFTISLSGPIIGGARTEAKSGEVAINTLIDTIDVITSILLILDEIRLIGVLVGPGRLSLTVSGPIFGEPLNKPSLPIERESYYFFHRMISTHFNIDPNLFRNIEKE